MIVKNIFREKVTMLIQLKFIGILIAILAGVIAGRKLPVRYTFFYFIISFIVLLAFVVLFVIAFFVETDMARLTVYYCLVFCVQICLFCFSSGVSIGFKKNMGIKGIAVLLSSLIPLPLGIGIAMIAKKLLGAG